MCEFCVRHGEGQKRCLATKNYSRDLLERDGRLDFTVHFLNTFETRTPPKLDRLERLSRTPFRSAARPLLTRAQKRNHYFSAADRRVEIDPRQCYGCGVCRAIAMPSPCTPALRTRRRPGSGDIGSEVERRLAPPGLCHLPTGD